MIKYVSIKEQVYRYLADKINEGSLVPNQSLDELSVSKNLKVSRTPAREAMIELASEGYLERIPRYGFIVKEVALEEAEEIYQIIGWNEGLAASLAISRMTEDNFNALNKIVEKMDKSVREKNIKNIMS